MKTRLITAVIFFNVGFLYAQPNILPHWKFVGPLATNEPPNNPFRSGQIDDITVDPANKDHIIVSSFFAGIWETNNIININNSDPWHILPGFPPRRICNPAL